MLASFICFYYLAHAFTCSNKEKHFKSSIETACLKHLPSRNMTVTLVTWRSVIESLYRQILGTSVVINKYFPGTMTPPVIVFGRNFHSYSFYLIVNSDSLHDISLHLMRWRRVKYFSLVLAQLFQYFFLTDKTCLPVLFLPCITWLKRSLVATNKNIFPVNIYSNMIKILNCSLNVWKETPFWILFEDYAMKKEVDRVHVDLKRMEKHLSNKVSS